MPWALPPPTACKEVSTTPNLPSGHCSAFSPEVLQQRPQRGHCLPRRAPRGAGASAMPWGGASLGVPLAPSTAAITGPRSTATRGARCTGRRLPASGVHGTQAGQTPRRPLGHQRSARLVAGQGLLPTCAPSSTSGLPALDTRRILMLCDSERETGFGEHRGDAVRGARALRQPQPGTGTATLQLVRNPWLQRRPPTTPSPALRLS